MKIEGQYYNWLRSYRELAWLSRDRAVIVLLTVDKSVSRELLMSHVRDFAMTCYGGVVEAAWTTQNDRLMEGSNNQLVRVRINYGYSPVLGEW